MLEKNVFLTFQEMELSGPKSIRKFQEGTFRAPNKKKRSKKTPYEISTPAKKNPQEANTASESSRKLKEF